ncbi:unnamed protein product [Larinioides sclopetarius]|uniref:Uncharacterized protein n=1 Tax=Larinioides sclopetarius TaxID=280406 RepID=A0AAV2BB50_9ARAC
MYEDSGKWCCGIAFLNAVWRIFVGPEDRKNFAFISCLHLNSHRIKFAFVGRRNLFGNFKSDISTSECKI